jgi:glyoxylase-like metal-dependent hydrolase (beta-lactamase superfamily II)
MGGLERLRGITSVLVRHEGQTYWRNQSPAVDPPYAVTPLSGLLTIDFAAGRYLWDNANSFPGGFFNHNRTVIVGREGFGANLIERRWFTIPNASLTTQRNQFRRLPHYILLSALDRAASLRWLGRGTFQGRPQDVVTTSTEDNGIQLALFFDGTTHLLTKTEQAYTDPERGDAVAEVVFPSYREMDGLKVPTGRQVRRAGSLGEDVRYTEFLVNTVLSDTLFQRPADFVDGSATTPPDTGVLTLAPDVYVARGVAGSNNSLFVVFQDYILVVEAYGNDAASQRTIATIKATAPGKPIRYLVATHHHDDHTGGVRGFIAEGASIVTTPGNREYFERMARATYTIEPDRLSRHPQPLSLVLVENKRRTFADSTHQVDVIDIGPSPHANEMLVAYLPNEKILVQGDLLNLPADGRMKAGNATTLHFARWLDQSGLVVERIVPVHGPVHTINQLREAVALMSPVAGP